MTVVRRLDWSARRLTRRPSSSLCLLDSRQPLERSELGVSKTTRSSSSGYAVYPHRMRVERAIRNWWPILAFVAIALATQTVFTSNVDANGQHAEDHLRSATAPFAIAFLIALIVWAAPKARRHVDVWVATATLGGAACLGLLGNLRVIHAIAGDAWTDTQANILGPARPGFASGHSLAELGEWVTLAAVILLHLPLALRGG